MGDNKRSKCTIGYKIGVTSNGFIYGMRFFNLIECCAVFPIRFNNTGNTKTANFTNSNEKSGFNLVSQGGSLKLILKIDGGWTEHEIKFCPFCGAEVELVEASRVRLTSIAKTEHDHYKEEFILRNYAMPESPVLS